MGKNKKWFVCTAAAATLLLVASAHGQTPLTPSDSSTNAWFGGSVGISGDTAIVGAAQADGSGIPAGAAYVFTRQSGGWGQVQKLTIPDAGTAPQFGSAVAIDGDTIVVGAKLAEVTVGANKVPAGAAYVFVRGGSSWALQQQLQADDASANSWFGTAVAISGNTVIVGAKLGPSPSGSAYVFVRSGGVWSQQAKLVPTDGHSGDQFGASVSISGDLAIVGTPFAAADASDAGAAYAYARSGGGWTLSGKLVSGEVNGHFGFSVAIDGTTAAVGAPGHDAGAVGNSGAVYVYQLAGSAWTRMATLTASDAKFGDGLGNAVALQGNAIVAGAQGEGDTRGAVYAFAGSGSNWTQLAKVGSPIDAVDVFFGGAVSVSNGTAVVGAPFADMGTASNQGAAYVIDPTKVQDSDGDGIPDAIDNCPTVANPDQANLDGDSLGDACDPDIDNDGTPNEQDGCPANASKTSPGVCGCDASDADADGDGSPDCVDQCPNDPLKTDPGACGCGIPDTDSDGDGIPDCKDTSSTPPGQEPGPGEEQQVPGVNNNGCGCTGSPAAVVGLLGLSCLGLISRRRNGR